MKNDDEWKEIRDRLDSKDAEIIEKYGFDIRKKFSESINKENILEKKKRRLTIKIICIILTIILIILLANDINGDIKQSKIQQDLSFTYSINNLEPVSRDINILGHGFYIYKSKDIEYYEIHVLRDNETYKDDLNEVYCKYYFEKWEDKDKQLFKIVESYSDSTSGTKTKRDWFLNFDTYIYADTEEEVIYATEAIIRFVEFMDKPNILANCYIQIGDRKILPNNYSGQTAEQIREMALTLYHNGSYY